MQFYNERVKMILSVQRVIKPVTDKLVDQTKKETFYIFSSVHFNQLVYIPYTGPMQVLYAVSGRFEDPRFQNL